MSASSRLDARDRRALGVGALAVLAVLLFRFAAAPAVDSMTTTRDRLDRERRLLAEERGLLATDDRIATEYEVASDRLLALAPRTFGGERSGPRLVEYLRNAARESHVYLASAQHLPESDSSIGALSRSQVEVRGETDFEGFLTFLRALETGEKLVRISRVRVEKPGQDRAVRGGGPEVLAFRFRAVGLGLPASDSLGDGAWSNAVVSPMSGADR